VGIWIAALVAAGLGALIGAPTLRVRGDYLAIITLAFGEIIPVAIRNLGDITIEIDGWRPVERLNLTGGENGVNPIGRPYLPGVDFDTQFVPWYFLILIIGAISLWAMNRMRDSRLGRAWMAIREDETAADCTGVNPVKTKLLAFALGASFSGFAGSFYAAKLQAITPGAFEFNVSIMLLCMVVLGGMGSLKGVILGGMLITLFDRILLAQLTFLVRWVGRSLGLATLASVDLTLWRWFFFGLGLVIVMLVRPEGLAGRREPGRAEATSDRRARHRPHLSVHPALPEHDRARQRPGRRALSAPRFGGRRRLPAALRRRRGGPRARPGARSPRLRGPGRQGGRAGQESGLRRSAPARDRARAGHRAQAVAARRADRRHEPARDRRPDRADRAAAARARARGPAHRAPHGGGDGDLRPYHRARLRHPDRGRHAHRAPTECEGHRGLSGQGVRAGAGDRMSGTGLLELSDVHAYYGNIRALKGVSLTVARGEIVTLIGSNGAGKTTTLRTVLGTVRPLRGTVTFGGKRIDKVPTHRIARLGIAQSP